MPDLCWNSWFFTDKRLQGVVTDITVQGFFPFPSLLNFSRLSILPHFHQTPPTKHQVSVTACSGSSCMVGTQIWKPPFPPVFSGAGHTATSVDERSHMWTTRQLKQPRLWPTPSGYYPRQQTLSSPPAAQKACLPADWQTHGKQGPLSLVTIQKAEQLPKQFILNGQNLVSNRWLPAAHLQFHPRTNQRKPNTFP